MRKRINKLLPWLLFLSIGLRSLVAPGYMFSNVDDEGNFSLGLTWCSGPNDIYAVEDHDLHHHGGDEPASHGNDGEHFTATCGLLTGSTSFIGNTIDFSAGLISPVTNPVQIEHDNFIYNPVYRNNHRPRAPPPLILVSS